MKYGLIIILVVIISSCNKSNIDLENLSGYWEIDEVILANGNKREFNINTTVDFIKLEADSSGFRKKLNPRLDGSFEMFDNREEIKIKSNDDGLWIMYNTPMATWEEEIIFLSKNKLEVLNKDSIRYIYKRFTPFNFD